MRVSSVAAGLAALASLVHGQTYKYCDAVGICYAGYTTEQGIQYGVAIPAGREPPFQIILQIAAPKSVGWAGIAWQGTMAYNPLAVAWPNGDSDVVVSSRMAYGLSLPQPYPDATYTELKGTGQNATHWTLTTLCEGCSAFLDVNGGDYMIPTTGEARLAWAQSAEQVIEPANNESAFFAHDTFGKWGHDMAMAQSPDFDAWVAAYSPGGEPSPFPSNSSVEGSSLISDSSSNSQPISSPPTSSTSVATPILISSSTPSSTSRTTRRVISPRPPSTTILSSTAQVTSTLSLSSTAQATSTVPSSSTVQATSTVPSSSTRNPSSTRIITTTRRSTTSRRPTTTLTLEPTSTRSRLFPWLPTPTTTRRITLPTLPTLPILPWGKRFPSPAAVRPNDFSRAAAIPESCPGTASPRFPGSVAEGWRATKVKGSLRSPRTVISDPLGNLLVIENGKGITAHKLDANGCIVESKDLVRQFNLNHGLTLTPDGKSLYASSMTQVLRWTYDPATMSVVGGSTIVVKTMYSGGHPTRSVYVPPHLPNLLLISHGSNDNWDYGAGDKTVGRSVIKAFDMTSVPTGGHAYNSTGYLTGWGLRNTVGLTFDGNNMLWGVENSMDELKRTGPSGVALDIHIDNPADELNYIGDVSKPNEDWYGYPTCFTVWAPESIVDRNFTVGDQFVAAPNATFDDDTCRNMSVPAKLSFQAHSAPLDLKFDKAFENLYVAFHGSWNRVPSTGFKVVQIPFHKDAAGNYNPVASPHSNSGYTDIWWNTNTTVCNPSTQCFRPVGLHFDTQTERMYVTSDAAMEGELWVLGKI
ncbi:iron reductase domain protein [Patellaria atrata CBS 101060]|uniref:Iron reductase domain protein n=1 Tax=Patellaria atrata CBS 101060 TaxID=1346257 RepID=A0A9P4VQW2_9PEZI|nr:iron reductase domain protein [Patellaria atrata CBS 101060]